jgi:hypothetical protein
MTRITPSRDVVRATHPDKNQNPQSGNLSARCLGYERIAGPVTRYMVHL